MTVGVGNFSKWLWAKVVKSCSTETVIKFLNQLIESDGVPKSIKVDNASAFKSTHFGACWARLNLETYFESLFNSLNMALQAKAVVEFW